MINGCEITKDVMGRKGWVFLKFVKDNCGRRMLRSLAGSC